MSSFPSRAAIFVLNVVVLAAIVVLLLSGCQVNHNPPRSLSGVKEVAPEVVVGSDGLTNEQRNVKDRLKVDSLPGAIKHLYVQSAMSGDVLLYSTVKGKVTSSGKRLSPTTVSETLSPASGRVFDPGVAFNLNGRTAYTREMLQDDGTYGSSIEYLYWWDVNGNYRQIYPNSGTVIMISDAPLPVKKAVISLEVEKAGK